MNSLMRRYIFSSWQPLPTNIVARLRRPLFGPIPHKPPTAPANVSRSAQALAPSSTTLQTKVMLESKDFISAQQLEPFQMVLVAEPPAKFRRGRCLASNKREPAWLPAQSGGLVGYAVGSCGSPIAS